MNLQSTSFGTLIETNTFVALLGNRNAQISSLQSEFSQFTFKRVKQVHGDRIVHTSPHSIEFSHEADAHYTSDKGLALCIATADCIPVIFYHDNPRWICNIHAGWRGVESRIVPKAITSLTRIGCKPGSLQVIVGPHIQMNSFEVGNDVRDQLLNSFEGEKSCMWQTLTEQKSKVNLHEILKAQLSSSGISMENCFFEFKDTVTNLDYHSYRRDRENAGRQITFVALKK